MMAPILLQPTLSLQKKQQMIQEHKKTIDEAFNDPTVVKPILSERKWGATPEKVVDIPGNMRKYFNANQHLFNPSQAETVSKVLDMPENDILLI